MLEQKEDHSALEFAVLVESVRARVAVAPASVIGTFASILLFLPFLYSQGVGLGPMVVWVAAIVILILGRNLYSRRVLVELARLEQAEVERVDRYLRISSILNQFTIGTGIWIMQSPSADPHVLPLFMTLICMIFCIGVMANLFSDAKSFAYSVPLLIGQPALFWVMQDDIGIALGVGMILAMTLMIMLVGRGSRIFRDSVLIRFEKDRLLVQVELEQEKTERALLEAQEANDSKTFFMAAASHDIKQPLFALGMLTDTLLMSDPSEEVKSILDKQRRNITAMSHHFDALMDLGKFQGGSFETHLSAVRLEDLALRIDGEFQPLCQYKGLDWYIDFVEATVNTDLEVLLRVFRNLLSNAVRFTEAGKITCLARLEDGRVRFEVSDSGPGIAVEERENIFPQFVRLENGVDHAEGAGLGLAIVDNINRALSLGLSMESELGRGTHFYFSVPSVNQ